MRLTPWEKGIVEWTEGDTAYLSVVFSWDAEKAYQRAVWYDSLGYEVRVGGPGVFVLGKMLRGVAVVGGEFPDAVRRHNPMATFASRGCPVGCWFCIVPALEGSEFTLIDNFKPRPILCDNNLSALPEEFQRHVIRRYQDTGTPLMDANSGFEPATFDEAVYRRWSAINRGPWRFAYDESGEREDVRRVCEMLCELPPKKKRVYVLIGNEPFDMCMDRIKEVIDWGAEPHVQPVMKLNAQKKTPWVRFDWTTQTLRDVARWANRYVWRSAPFKQYSAHYRRGRAGSVSSEHPRLEIAMRQD